MLGEADSGFEAHLRDALPTAAFRHDDTAYREHPRGAPLGREALVVAPSTVAEVSQVIKAAAEARVAVIPYGGGTGLVTGQVLPEGARPVVLTLERMRAIRSIHPTENVLVAEAGAILADVQQAAQAEDRLFPLSLASEGSARIGGLLATNAGGVNVLRYGNARDLCLGLEAVLPDGSVWHGLKRLRKDNTGYDLRNLLIGAEGTLGVITAASLRLYPIPVGRGTALLKVANPAAALDLLALAGKRIGTGISAFELISGQGPRFLQETMPDIRLPFDEPWPWSVLIDLGLAASQDPGAALEGLFEAAVTDGLVNDGIIAQSEAQRTELWAMRESIPLGNRNIGAIASHDISLPLSHIPAFIDRAPQKLAQLGSFRINCFGHLGDGNLHFNLFPLPGEERQARLADKAAATRIVHDLVDEMDGSISAEHGVGRLKVKDLERYGDPTKLAAMRAIKAALDPHGIMNPGAVLAAPTP
ncbi:MAG: FAD-binding oxidoreductase [Pseudomonadota bacterium]